MNKKALFILPVLLSLLLLGSVFVTSASSSITVNANLQASSIDVANEVNEIIIPFETLSLNMNNIDTTDEPVTVKFKVTNNRTDTVYTEIHKYESASNKRLDISHVAIRADTIGKNAFPVAGESTKMTVSVKSTHPDVSSDLASRELTISRNIDNTSCSSILSTNNDASSGVYTINPSGDPIEVYCDMDTDGGGWTEINRSIARTMVGKNGGGLEAKQSTFGSGFDGDKPYFQTNSNPGGGMEYDINTGFEFDQMYLENVGFKSTSFKTSNDDTSEYEAGKYVMNVWEYTGGGPNGFRGDIGFGVPADSGPTTTYTGDGGSFGSNNGVTDFPFNFETSNGKIFSTGTADTTLRIAASESGGQDEGWRWERGSIYVR